MADAERGLGRPERALDLARSDEARRLPRQSWDDYADAVWDDLVAGTLPGV